MKMSLTLIFCFLTTFSYAQAEMEKASKVPSVDLLLKAIKEGASYKIEKANPICPSIVQLSKDHSEYSKDKNQKAGDISFRLNGYEKNGETLQSHNLAFNFRPTAEKGYTSLTRDCDFILGIACHFESQTIGKNDISIQASAKVITLAMIAFSKSSFKFDSVSNKITYTLKGNGVDDIVCNYTSAPELSSDIKALVATKEAMKSPAKEIYDAKRSAKPSEGVSQNGQKSSSAAKTINVK